MLALIYQHHGSVMGTIFTWGWCISELQRSSSHCRPPCRVLPSFHGHIRSARNKPWADVGVTLLDTKKLLRLDVGPCKYGVLEVLSLKKQSANWETTQILLNLLLSLRKTMIAVIIVAVLHQFWTYPLLVHSSIWYFSFVNLVRETDPVGVTSLWEKSSPELLRVHPEGFDTFKMFKATSSKVLCGNLRSKHIPKMCHLTS